jgi:hypothetical protein
MKRNPESAPALESGVVIEKSPEYTTIRGGCYVLTFPSDKPYAVLEDNVGNRWAELSHLGKIDTAEHRDETYALEPPTVEFDGQYAYVHIASKSTAWDHKDQVWICRPDDIEMYYVLSGHGHITECEMLGGNIDGPKGGTYPSKKCFNQVFNPEPTSSEKPTRSANHPSHLNVSGAFRTGNHDGQFTPAPWYFAMQKNDSSAYLTVSLGVEIEKQDFMSFDYLPYEDSFSFRLDYQGHTQVDGAFRTPSLLMQFTQDPYDGINDYREKLHSLNFIRAAAKNEPAEWHKRPEYCTWGAQVKAARLAHGTRPEDFATEAFFNFRRHDLANRGVWLPNVTIDSKWQESFGTLTVDRTKWPNFENVIDELHGNDQKVMLWDPMWHAEGVDPDLCIKGPEGNPIAIDPTNPKWRELKRQQIHRALGANGYNADGLKIDFSGNIPSGHHYQTHGKAWGAHLLHEHYKVIYDAAKDVKPDALIITHSPNPYFADVTDMIRLNDINDHRDINRQMRHRAKVARAAIPNALVNTDNWPIRTIENWRKYLKIQAKLGVVAFYDNFFGEYTDADYAALRTAGFSR